MASSRAKVEMKDVWPAATFSDASKQDKDTGIKKLLAALRRACNEAKIPQTLRQLESYESPGRKNRRKIREGQARLRAKLAENFPIQSKPKKKFGDKR